MRTSLILTIVAGCTRNNELLFSTDECDTETFATTEFAGHDAAVLLPGGAGEFEFVTDSFGGATALTLGISSTEAPYGMRRDCPRAPDWTGDYLVVPADLHLTTADGYLDLTLADRVVEFPISGDLMFGDELLAADVVHPFAHSQAPPYALRVRLSLGQVWVEECYDEGTEVRCMPVYATDWEGEFTAPVDP